MAYDNELENLRRFGELYGPGGTAARALRKSSRQSRMGGRIGRGGGGAAAVSDSGSYGVEIVLPEGRPRWTGGRCIAMSWIDGEPLLASRCASLPPSELPLVRFGIEATLSQMLDEGYMHADPHGGNLLRSIAPPPSRARGLLNRLLRRPPPPPRLAYLDFGLVSTVPQQVRDGLVCAVAYLLFARDTKAVAGLFSELMLLPEEELQSSTTRRQLEDALEDLAQSVLVPPPDGSQEGELPRLRFEKLITELALIAPRFRLQLPPYFLNNARALATLEGMAKSADESFDVLQAVYPFALRRLLGMRVPTQPASSSSSPTPLLHLSFPFPHTARARQRAPLTSLLLALRPPMPIPHNSRPQGLPAAADDAPRPHTRRRRPAGPIARVTDARRRRAPLRPAAQAAACRRHPYTRRPPSWRGRGQSVRVQPWKEGASWPRLNEGGTNGNCSAERYGDVEHACASFVVPSRVSPCEPMARCGRGRERARRAQNFPDIRGRESIKR